MPTFRDIRNLIECTAMYELLYWIMVLTEDELSLIEFAKEYIYTFLSEFGEFLPFAVIMENGEVIPLEHEENDQSSSPTELINIYKNYFNEERENNNEYQLGLICIDILVHTPMQNNKRTGVEYLLFGTNYIKKNSSIL